MSKQLDERIEKAMRTPTDEELHISPIDVVYSDGNMEVYNQRSYPVVKANEIIQRARNDLSLAQLKGFAFVLSLVKPTDTEGQWYEFSVKNYCKVLGIDEDNGGNYTYVKKTFKSLRDTSFWLMDENGKESTVGYLEKVEMSKGSGKVRVRFDESIQKYILGLVNNYTQYSLLYTIPMQSAYSFKLYELLRSYAFTGEHTFDIEEFKKLLGCKYENFKDLRIKVIETAVREINLYTDIEVKWGPAKKKGKKVIAITFYIASKNTWEKAVAERRATKEIDRNKNEVEGQMSLSDFS